MPRCASGRGGADPALIAYRGIVVSSGATPAVSPAGVPGVGLLVSVNVAHVRTDAWTGSVGRSGIDKRPAPTRVRLADHQVAGDAVLNRRHHGGPDQAVYAYARKDAQWWQTQLGRQIPPGRFGENLTTEGLSLTGALIGERWLVGSAQLEVSAPRIPCAVFAGFWDVPDLVKRFTARGWPGAYLRIVTEGEVGAGDEIAVTHHPDHGVTIGEVFRALTGDRSLAAHVLTAGQLPAKHRTTLMRLVQAR